MDNPLIVPVNKRRFIFRVNEVLFSTEGNPIDPIWDVRLIECFDPSKPGGRTPMMMSLQEVLQYREHAGHVRYMWLQLLYSFGVEDFQIQREYKIQCDKEGHYQDNPHFQKEIDEEKRRRQASDPFSFGG